MDKAIFKYSNNGKELLCSKCGKRIKLEKDFDEMTKFAADGVVTLLAQYCDEHKYLSMYGNDRRREMIRRGIKEQLREGIMNRNVLDVLITRPNQELIIMRGIPGSGKSTKGKSLVGEGIIHSTDSLIELNGDYNAYFKRMVDSGDWSEHGRMHNRNFLNAKASIEEGISPVIIDNTNIKAAEPKKYVEAALELGLSEDNIKIVDVGDGGVSVEMLAERNTHNVPLKTIKRMLNSHKGVGPLTVKGILEAKGGLKNNITDRVLYSAVVLTPESRNKLLKFMGNFISDLGKNGSKIIAHHMTIVFGKGLEDKGEIGKTVTLKVTHLGINDVVTAVGVEGYPSANETPHITISVNVDKGGKPFMSNQITEWEKLGPEYNITVTGIVTEVTT